MFEYCKSLIELVLSSFDMTYVIDIKYAFSGCKNLRSITIPKTVKTIGAAAFMGCKKLNKVTMKYGLKVISQDVFCDCPKLTRVVVPSSVKRIGTSAFDGCLKLKEITILTKKLKAELIGDDAFKKIQKKAVFYLPASKRKAYKKILLQRGATKKMRFEEE